MDLKRVGILEKDDFSKQALESLDRFYDVSAYDGNTDIKEFVADKYAIFVRLAYQIDDTMVSKAKGLRYICSPTTGLNHISVSSSNIKIISLQGEYDFLSSIRATPEHIVGLTFALLRNYKFAFRTEKNYEWNRDYYRGYELYNSNIGIIGYGRIGKLLCGFFQAFGAKLHVYEVNKNQCANLIDSSIVICNSIEDVIQSSEIIILCVNYENKNKNMINKKHFNLMKGKYFVNASRGELVNENDLIDFIKKREFRGVALDVIANETGDKSNYRNILELSTDANVIITPHIGGATYTSMRRTEEFIVRKFLEIEELL